MNFGELQFQPDMSIPRQSRLRIGRVDLGLRAANRLSTLSSDTAAAISSSAMAAETRPC